MAETTLRAKLRKSLPNDADRVVDAYKRRWAATKPEELLLYIESDMAFRNRTVELTEIKASYAKAPVFSYIFSWESNAYDGLLRAAHGLEVPFTMNIQTLRRPFLGLVGLGAWPGK